MNPDYPNELAAKIKENPALFEDADDAMLGDLIFHYVEGELPAQDAADVEAMIRENAKAKAMYARVLAANRFSSSPEGAAWLAGLPERVLSPRATPHSKEDELEVMPQEAREEGSAPSFLEWIKFSLNSLFAEYNPLSVAGSVDTLTGANQYTIKTPFGEAKLDVFAQQEQPGIKARVVFRIHAPGKHWPLHILWERKKPTGELIGDPVILAFGESQQKLEHRFDLQANDELWAFAYHSNPTVAL